MGPFRGRKRGQGLDFDDLRLYSPGDDTRHIDWKVSARQNQLHTRLYREEKEQIVTLAVDFTSPMFTGSDRLLAVSAGKLCASLAWYVCESGGRCGLVVQTDTHTASLKPSGGEKGALAVCAMLHKQFKAAKALSPEAPSEAQTTTPNDTHTAEYKLKSEKKSDNHANTNGDTTLTLSDPLVSLIDHLTNIGRHAGCVILLSGMDAPMETLQQPLAKLLIAHKTALILQQDKLEIDGLPDGHYHFKTKNTTASVVLGKRTSAALKEALQDQHEALLAKLQSLQLPVFSSQINHDKLRLDLARLGLLA